MRNTTKILIFQILIDYLYSKITHLNNYSDKNHKLTVIEDINHFQPQLPKNKRALIKLSPIAWLTAIKEHPNIRHFNYTGLTYEMVKALNNNGYIVDICDVFEEFIPTKVYDLFIGHGGKCVKTIDKLDQRTTILQYVSGEYWKGFKKESVERYAAFKERNKVKENLVIRREIEDMIVGEECLTKKADRLFTSKCPRMIESFGDYKKKFFFTGYAAYIEELLFVPQSEKDYDNGRNNFIYVGGTGGNIQKGMDILIETFIKTPDLNLFVYCKVEKEILTYYKKELNAKNIHYIYHWRFSPFRKELRNLLRITNYTVHAPINTGLGTAFIGSMGLGLIPVGYVDLVAPENSCVLSDSWRIESMVQCVKDASNKSKEWCKNASELTVGNFKDYFSVEGFRIKFNQLIEEICANGKKH
jgi:hypothetical protein